MSRLSKSKINKGKNKVQSPLVDTIAEAILDKQGEDLVVLDLSNLADAPCDKFIICHALVNVQIKALADYVIDCVKEKRNIMPYHKEGFNNLEWVIIDYIEVVVHIFLKSKREFYCLEDLWGDSKQKTIN